MPRPVYPFAAFVGQEKVKAALILNAVDSKLGGVLIVGPKGSGKSTLVRALEAVLPSTECVEGCRFNCNPSDSSHLCPSCRERLARDGKLPVASRPIRIVELPVSASEDGLLGAIDPEEALLKGANVLQPGLLGRANHNILYIDEINLLPSHIIDCILDPAVSGWNVVQREGLSSVHPSRFTLVASMNPEEGELRPQILDRFALRVEMESLMDPRQREEITRRNLLFEEDPVGFCKEYEEEQSRLRMRILKARGSLSGVKVPEAVMRGIAEACSRLKVEGVRSDISILRGARALAAFEGRNTVEPSDVFTVFNLAVSHRIKGDDGTTSLGAGRSEELKRILFREDSESVAEQVPGFHPAPEITQRTPSPYRALRKTGRRRVPRHLSGVIYILIVSFMLISLSIVSSMATLLFQIMFLGTPLNELTGALTLPRILAHLAVIAPAFVIILLISSRVRRPVVYLYTYLGSGLTRRLIWRQGWPEYKKNRNEQVVMEVSNILNVPLYASFRRLYKMVVEKGVKLLQAGAKERRMRYRLLFERRAIRGLKGFVARQSKTKAKSDRGRYISYEFPKRRPWDVALGPTMRAAAPFQRSRERMGLALRVKVEDIRVKVRETRAPVTMVLLLDMSESMVSSLANVRNAVASMHEMANKRRARVGLVIFKGQDAVTLQAPTTNLGLVVKRMTDVGASDLTPLASGMYEAWRVLRNDKGKNREAIPVLVVISDGIANIPLASPLSRHTRSRFQNQAQADVLDVASLLRREGVWTVIINPSHVQEEALWGSYDERTVQTGKQQLTPTELLKHISRITGGYYYGIGEGGKLEQTILTEAFRVLSG